MEREYIINSTNGDIYVEGLDGCMCCLDLEYLYGILSGNIEKPLISEELAADIINDVKNDTEIFSMLYVPYTDERGRDCVDYLLLYIDMKEMTITFGKPRELEVVTCSIPELIKEMEDNPCYIDIPTLTCLEVSEQFGLALLNFYKDLLNMKDKVSEFHPHAHETHLVKQVDESKEDTLDIIVYNETSGRYIEYNKDVLYIALKLLKKAEAFDERSKDLSKEVTVKTRRNKQYKAKLLVSKSSPTEVAITYSCVNLDDVTLTLTKDEVLDILDIEVSKEDIPCFNDLRIGPCKLTEDLRYIEGINYYACNHYFVSVDYLRLAINSTYRYFTSMETIIPLYNKNSVHIVQWREFNLQDLDKLLNTIKVSDVGKSHQSILNKLEDDGLPESHLPCIKFEEVSEFIKRFGYRKAYEYNLLECPYVLYALVANNLECVTGVYSLEESDIDSAVTDMGIYYGVIKPTETEDSDVGIGWKMY